MLRETPPPKEFLTSVDIALRAILTLRDAGSVTVSSLAHELDVTASSAHRTLQMLRYRGFAVQAQNRSYLPGPALAARHVARGEGEELIKLCQHHMRGIVAATGETCHLVTLSENQCNFLYTEESAKPVRVGDRRGQVIPAEQNSGGLAMLADLSAKDLRTLYPTMPDTEFAELRRKLHKFRSQGFATNTGIFEPEVSALGLALHNDLGDTLGAIAIAVPTARFPEVREECIRALRTYGADLNRTLERSGMFVHQ